MTVFKGTHGADLINGTADKDIFKIGQGGHDEIHGDAGNDRILLKDKYELLDVLEGGAGKDTVSLAGAYAGTVVFNAGTIQSIEVLTFGGAFDYDVSIANGTLAAADKLTVNAKMTGGHSLAFDGHALNQGHLTLHDGAGDDALIGGDSSDKIYLSGGGADDVRGRDGNDTFYGGSQFFTGDKVNGGGGSDTLVLTGLAFGDNLVLTGTMMTNVETLILKNTTYSIQLNDANLAAGESLTIDATLAHNVNINAGLEGDGFITFFGSDATDNYTGGSRTDTLILTQGGSDFARGAGGADDFTCGTGDQTFYYQAAGESSSVNHDFMHGFNASAEDKIDLDIAISAVQSASGAVSNATFDADLGNALDDGLGTGKALVFTVNGGDLIGHALLIVDFDNAAGYSTSDMVIDVTGFTGAFDTTDFI